MAGPGVVPYNAASFLAALFLLEFGADKFIDHTAVVAQRTGVSETVIGLITAGGEWEELAVVVASLARGRSSLALGNVIGSAISNILGAFSLGLLFYSSEEPIQFDRSARIYSVFLLLLTTLAVPVAYFPAHAIWVAAGSVLVVAFGAYLLGVGAAIGRGVLTPPEDSDSESDDGSSDTSGETGLDGGRALPSEGVQSEMSPLLTAPPWTHRKPLQHHVFHLILGFLAICLSGYILSQAATNITDQVGISDVFFGVIILALATTLPEKFIAVMSGRRRHPGILVANCVGSNVFLLSLCLGVIMLGTKGALDEGGVTVAEIGVLWVSTLGVVLTVWFGARLRRWIGALMVAGYVAFIVLEFTTVHRDAD